MTPVELVVSRFDDARQTPSGWQARCRAHDDVQASLSISEGEDGRALLHCHAGCKPEAIVKAIGLTMRDLFSVNGNGHKPMRRIVAHYNYCNELGTLLFQSVRYDPKDFRQRQPKPDGKEGWQWNLEGVRLVLYRLPELLAADPSAVVFISEGEKDCDRLAKLELVGTTNAMGAGKWRAEYAQDLRGRRVVILPDNDDPGRKHALDVARSLVGKAASIKVVELPGLPEKGDVSDYLDQGHTAEELLHMVSTAPEWTPPPAPAPSSAATPTGEQFTLTDTGLAERFAKQHGADVRYCYPWQKWLAWDDTRWSPDAAAAIEQKAKQTARAIYQEAADEPDSDRRGALAKFARQSESAAKRAAMVQLARSEPGIPILPDALDQDDYLLNCPNGTLNLRTNELHTHRREDLITKLCPTPYEPAAECSLWLACLQRIFYRRQSLITFLQRLFGYCLTGDVLEQLLAIFYGVGANGKSTLLGILMEMLGTDYAMKGVRDLLMAKKQEGHSTDRADLFGKRLVVCIETEERRRLAESLVKDLTGGDRQRARKMYQDNFEFRPTHKLILAVNHKPTITGTDHAIWRRVKLVPFNVIIPPAERDRSLQAKLREELPGILAWCVRGCLDWQRDGLGAPEEVAAATSDYQIEQDTLSRFLEESCIIDGSARAKASDLLAAYREWSGDKHIRQLDFGQALTERGFQRFTSNGTWYKGVGLETDL